MENSEQTQPASASAPPPLPLSRLEEITNSVRCPLTPPWLSRNTANTCSALPPGLRRRSLIGIRLRPPFHRVLEYHHHQHHSPIARPRNLDAHLAAAIQIRHQQHHNRARARLIHDRCSEEGHAFCRGCL